MELPILPDIVIILGLSVLIILLFQKLKLPSILGFLLTGIIAGPHGINLVRATHEVELLSEIGIIFLLFVIGIEFSLKGLASVKNTVLWGGLMQVGGTIGLTTLVAYWAGIPIQSAIFLGFLLSMSSTAIVLKMLQERGELSSPHGRVSVAILIFQDIVVVLMMLVTPLLAGEMEDPLVELTWLVVKVVGIIGVVILLARYVVPTLFTLVVRTKSRELFILTVVVICFATAWLTSSVGLSLALGAFFAGLIISESDYSHQATANILPFREIFISFFFVSVGMLLDLEFFFAHIGIILLLSVSVMVLKAVIIAVTVLVLRYPRKTIFITALSLFQVGEFAFLLSATGMSYDLLTNDIYQYFLSISIISMGATPFVIANAPAITRLIMKTPVPSPVRRGIDSITRQKETLEHNESLHEDLRDHVVIIGYGINGQNVAKAAFQANIPYIVIELDPQAIKIAKENNSPYVFGDASDEIILQHVQIHKARVVVVAISSPQATKQIVRSVREFTKTAYIIIRTRYINEIEENIKLGADEVIPEEFETSIEIFTRVLKKYLVPNDEIQSFVNQIRTRNYEMLRSLPVLTNPFSQMSIPDMDIATITVQQGRNKIVGKTIAESGLRVNYNITVLAIRREGAYLSEITPAEEIQQDDVLYLFGNPDNIVRVAKYLTLS